MKELLILSGKGGTGKTTVASSFIRLSEASTYADCDVEAPNLHLAVNARGGRHEDFSGMGKAEIDAEKCVSCGECARRCRFGAIEERDGVPSVDAFACEGCGVCELVCPAGAVSMVPSVSGTLSLYENGSVFSTAKLRTGAGVSGKLVSAVKRNMRDRARPGPFAIIDGSPGIGCPVIASLSGAHAVLMVAEPTLSGLSDLRRVMKTAEAFRPAIGVVVNKWDVNPSICEKIRKYCLDAGAAWLGGIPFDPAVPEAVNEGKTAVDRDCPAGRAIREIYKKTIDSLLNGKGEEK